MMTKEMLLAMALGGGGGGGGAAKIQVVEMSASDTAVTLEEDKFYIFPTMSTLTVTCPTTGQYQFRFTSGATPTTFSMANIVMPSDFSVKASTIYEINVLEGYGTFSIWSAS